MKKIIITSLLLLPAIAFGYNNLWEYYGGHLPTIAQRSAVYSEYGGAGLYKGTAEQNQYLLNALTTKFTLGSLAPLPGATVEGTSTAGWTDDGSIVRLNTAADNVGIGTANPSMKLQVQGSAYVTSELSVSGGTFNFSNGSASSATNTITVLNNGYIGFSSTTPSRHLSSQGDAFFSGTTTTGVIVATSTIVTPRIRVTGGTQYTLPATDGSANQVLSTNGSGTLSFAAPNTEWAQLGEQVLSTANATSTVTFTPTATTTDLIVTFDVVGASAQNTMRMTFNTDYAGGSTNYSSRTFTNYAYDGAGSTNADAYISNSGNATSTAQYYEFHIRNNATRNKIGFFSGITDTTLPAIITGTLRWANTTDQISTINIRTNDVAQTWSAGTRLRIYGRSS